MDMEMENNIALTFDAVINKCLENPEQKSTLKNIFLEHLKIKLDYLIESQEFENVFNCFKIAQDLFDEDSDVLNVLGVVLNRIEKPLEALNYLNKAYRLCPTNLKILDNYENVINQWVPRWHFSMLNDQNRNRCYEKAIKKILSEGNYENILDIGTGTGLLSIYCYESGVKNIYACETDEIMLDIAKEIIEKNNIPIKLLPKHSTKINLNELNVKDGFNLIITEIFDCGGFGEGVLSSLIHAKEHLINPDNGRILPEKIKMYVVGVDKICVAEKLKQIDNSLENSIYLKNTLLVPETTNSPYEPLEQLCSTMQLVTESAYAFTVDFNDLKSMKDAFEGKINPKVKLISVTDDVNLEGFLVYFELYLADKIILRNFNILNDEQSEQQQQKNNEFNIRCWDPVIFRLNRPLKLCKYQVLFVNLSCKNGMLQLTHDYDNITNHKLLKIDPDIFSFLSDDKYISELEYNVSKVLEKYKNDKFNIFGDFSLFPHIGINFLKENKITKLYCSSNIKDIIIEIAKWNCISNDLIEFIDNFDKLLELSGSIKFDLILLQPINNDGLLNDEHLKYYDQLKMNCLTKNGMIFPHKIDLCCKLIYSNWLNNVTKITLPSSSSSVNNSYNNDDDDDNVLEKYNIRNILNRYSTKHQYEFLDYDCINISDVFTISSIQFNNDLYEKDIVVNLNPSSLNLKDFYINGIVYFYKVYFHKNSTKPLLTNRKKSFIKLNCFVENFIPNENRSNCTVKFIQNEFIFRCKILDNSNNSSNTNPFNVVTQDK